MCPSLTNFEDVFNNLFSVEIAVRDVSSKQIF